MTARPRLVLPALALLVAVSVGCGPAPPPTGLLIAHALGGLDVPYSNSREALERNYAAGRRWFEVDLALTADGRLVCFHEGLEKVVDLQRPITETPAAVMLSHRFDGRYTLIDFAWLLARMETLEDLVVVTDTKRWTAPVCAAFERDLAPVPRSVRRRVVPQIYRPEDLAPVREIEARLTRFRYVIFTLYFISISDDDVVLFTARAHIPIVTMNTERFNAAVAARLHALGARVYVHTLNDHAEIVRFAGAGADGFYTDTYRPFSDYFPLGVQPKIGAR